jgi:hypothetical protein
MRQDGHRADPRLSGGPKGSRTPDLLAASQALYQLSYGPVFVQVRGGSRPARVFEQRSERSSLDSKRYHWEIAVGVTSDEA